MGRNWEYWGLIGWIVASAFVVFSGKMTVLKKS